jgi:hypothetical protein|tara:strand:+ start:230 stop:409 length:180 start_codon:yes stop_codon:yes gene_type:complete
MKVLGNIPSLTKELLQHLQDLFPNQLPAGEISIEELRYLQGQQSVIRKLEELYNQDEEI